MTKRRTIYLNIFDQLLERTIAIDKPPAKKKARIEHQQKQNLENSANGAEDEEE